FHVYSVHSPVVTHHPHLFPYTTLFRSRLPAVGLAHVDDRFLLRSEESPEMALATTDPPEVEDRVGGRLGLVGVHLAEAVERDPRRGDPAPGNDPRPQRLLARERLDVGELRTVID